MASLQERAGSHRVLFCYHGKLHSFTIGKVENDEAEAKTRQVDHLLMRLKQRLIVLPDGTDIVTFVEHDGKPPDTGPTLPSAPRRTVWEALYLQASELAELLRQNNATNQPFACH